MIDETLTMIPGPTPVHPRILDALARPTVSHVAPVFVEAFKSALADFKKLCQSSLGQPFIVAGSGTLAMEMALVNSVAPGWIASSGMDTYTGEFKEQIPKLKGHCPLGRLGTESEVSAAVCFLLSDASAYHTGASLLIDGGYSLY